MEAVPSSPMGLGGQPKAGGGVIAAAGDRVEPGASLHLSIELQGPWGTQDVQQVVVAGAHHALVLSGDPQRPAASESSDAEHLGARLLDGLGIYYSRQWHEADRDIAAL